MRNGNKTDNGVHEVGTEETRLAYQNDTPGQQVEEYLSQIALQNEEKQESARKHFSQVFDNPLKGFPYNEAFEVTEIKEKVEYAEYKFKNKNDAQKALDYFKSQQQIDLDINDDGLSQGELAIDAGKKDMTKQHKEVLKKFKPKVLTTEIKEEEMSEGAMSDLFLDIQQGMTAKDIAKNYPVSLQQAKEFLKDYYSQKKKPLKMGEVTEGKKIQDIARKHKRELQKIQKSGNLELSKKAEDELYQWASNSGEIHGDEEDEFWDWIDSNLDDLVKGKIKESTISEAKNLMPEVQKIVDTKGAAKVGGVMLDMFTASVLTQAYAKVSDANKKKMESSNIQTLVNLAQKVMGMKEELQLEEAHPCKGLSEDDPCWKDYKQVGMKKKNGKEVPNCVPKEDVEEGAMDGQKMTGQEISTYFRKNPIRDKDLKKAVEIALDHSGAMNYAIKQIEKLKKGLSKKTEVKKALQFANEEVKYKLNVGVVFTEDKKESVTESKDEPLAKMFKTTNKTALAGIMKMLDMTDVKVIQAMQKQNPKGFMKTVMQLGEDVMGKDPLKGKYPFQKKFSVESTFREMFETDLQEETIVYKVKGIQKPETDKFNQSAKMMKLKVSFKKQGSDTHVTMTGNKKQLRDFDSIARGKSSYGDPSTVQHFDESLEEALSKISRDKNLSKKDIDGIEDHIIKSYINKKTLSKISFDDDEIFHAGTGKTIFTSKDYIGKMTIDDLIKALEKKVK